MRDFEDELPGYLNNERICDELGRLRLRSGVENINDNLRACYEKLIAIGVIDKRELQLLEAWLRDLQCL